MGRPTTEPSATEPTATEPSAAEQSATLTDEELQEVAAGADYEGNPAGFSPSSTTQVQWDSGSSITGGSSGGGLS